MSAPPKSRKPEALRDFFFLAPVAMRIEGGIADTMFCSFFNVGLLFCLFLLDVCGTDM